MPSRSRPGLFAVALYLCGCLLTLAGSRACAGTAPQQPATAASKGNGVSTETVEIFVRRIELEHLLGDRAELFATVEVVPHMDAVLHAIRFHSVRLDGTTPVYLDPLEGEYTLHSGQPLLLPHSRLFVYYADFPTPSAMDDMLAAHHVQLTGEVRAGLQLSFLAKLLTRDLHPVVALPLQQSVPFDEAAVDAPTQLGIGILAVAQRALGASASTLERIAGVRIQVEVDPVSDAERSDTVLVRNHYTLRSKAGTTEQVCERLGFWMDAHHVLVPAEALEPWAYSVLAAQAIANDPRSVDLGSVQITVTSVHPNMQEGTPRWQAAPGAFTVERRGHPPALHLLTAEGRSVSILDRESPDNYALLGFATPVGQPAHAGTGSGSVSVLRRPAGTDQSLRRLVLGTAPTPGSSLLPRPVDDTVFGSPVRIDGVVVGMVAGENTLVPLSSVPHLNNSRLQSASPP